MKILVTILSLVLMTGTSFSATPECSKIKTNNPALGLINDLMDHAKGSAEVIIENIQKDSPDENFLAYHFGSINTALYMVSTSFFRLRETPIRVLPDEAAVFSKIIIHDRRYSWTSAIGCYRGIYSYACDVNEGDKAMLIVKLKDLVQAATDVTDSKSVSCYIRD